MADAAVNRKREMDPTGEAKRLRSDLVENDDVIAEILIGDLQFDYPVFVFRNLAELLFESNVGVDLNDWPENIVPKYSMQIYGSCNGLICVELDYVNILVWNPYTGESKLLPKPNVCNDVTTDMYGFGYDSSSGDYKVVRGSWSNDGGSVVEVFTLKSGLWRQWCVDFVLDGQGCFLNGALHWVQLEWEDWEYIVGAKIVSFDLAEEKFEEMVQCPDPVAECEECYCSVGIGVIEDCLTVCIEPNESDLSIWMMKEYGVKESWNEVVSISREALPKELNLSLRPLSISKDGEVFLNLNRNVFALYSSKDKRFKAVALTHQHVDFDTAIYAESLVSPVTGHLAKQTWEQHIMRRHMNTNSSKILLPIPLYSVDYEALLKYVKEVDVHLASKYFDYPILIRNLNQLFSGHATSRVFQCANLWFLQWLDMLGG
ncbi:PREDICTED: F-box/kelch-repeat protein At3g06240-like [Fragaria vesca subsp. vesca]